MRTGFDRMRQAREAVKKAAEEEKAAVAATKIRRSTSYHIAFKADVVKSLNSNRKKAIASYSPRCRSPLSKGRGVSPA